MLCVYPDFYIFPSLLVWKKTNYLRRDDQFHSFFFLGFHYLFITDVPDHLYSQKFFEMMSSALASWRMESSDLPLLRMAPQIAEVLNWPLNLPVTLSTSAAFIWMDTWSLASMTWFHSTYRSTNFQAPFCMLSECLGPCAVPLARTPAYLVSLILSRNLRASYKIDFFPIWNLFC